MGGISVTFYVRALGTVIHSYRSLTSRSIGGVTLLFVLPLTADHNLLRERRPEFGAQELCESRGGRPGLPVPNKPYGLCGN